MQVESKVMTFMHIVAQYVLVGSLFLISQELNYNQWYSIIICFLMGIGYRVTRPTVRQCTAYHYSVMKSQLGNKSPWVFTIALFLLTSVGFSIFIGAMAAMVWMGVNIYVAMTLVLIFAAVYDYWADRNTITDFQLIQSYKHN